MAQVITTDSKFWDLNDLSLESLQKAVGGYIEMVRPLNRYDRIMYVNEDGIGKGLRPNPQATELAGFVILGDVVLLTPEETREEMDADEL